jgi:hypothetical protein
MAMLFNMNGVEHLEMGPTYQTYWVSYHKNDTTYTLYLYDGVVEKIDTLVVKLK